ncbi:malonyl-CoA synthase [Azoarcus sp. DN11]|uniref:malonate--CoA ligase n=1 Tax=Azoarcus sp. DN11 TaxID=356837 RepID=UPI000EB2401F|nr:malonyl-CoA synthase [Azoarcus sp. DN11]AYH43560.1 malonyl-CoA synthase [Azoarcus sp. DN11]
MNHNLYALLQARFPSDPHAPCLILPGGRTITYGELHEQSGRYANLLSSLGVKAGDRVAVQVEKTPEAVFLYLGCLRAGGVFLPMNPAYQRGEIEHFLRDATPTLFVFRPQMRDVAEGVAREAGVPHTLALADDGTGSLVEQAVQHDAAFETAIRADGDLAAILYTSGTTGRAKGAMLSHRNLTVNCEILHETWGFRPGDVLLHMLPIFHFHGLFVAIHCALWNGSAMYFEPRFDPNRTLELLPRSTVFMGVPTYYVRLLADPAFTADTCRRMRLFISGSAPLLADTFTEFAQRSGHTILERYGMTEGGMFVSNPYDGERRCGSVGLPLPGLSLRVVNDDGAPVAPGEIGNIQVKGENVFVGYWRLPEKTREEHTDDGFFRTGDLGRLEADGYLTIIGRSKDLVITGGLNVYPKEIETVIDALPGVVESAVIGVPHPDFGEAVTAVVVRDRANGAALTEGSVIAAVKAQLANFKVPKSVVFVDDLPRNAMGKVQKNVLRDQVPTLKAASGAAAVA